MDIGVVIGPAGIVLGWLLAEGSERSRAKRATKADDERRAKERVAVVVREARAFAGETRGFAFTVYAQQAGGYPREQGPDAANLAWRNLEVTISECELLGPFWVPEASEPFVAQGRECMATLVRLQTDFVAADVELIQTQLGGLDDAIAGIVTRARSELLGK